MVTSISKASPLQQKLPLSVLLRYMALGLLPSLAASSVLPFLSVFFVNSLHFSVPTTGTILGVSTAINAALAIVAGGVIDRFNRTTVSRIGIGITCILPAVLILAPYKPLVFAALFLASFGSSLFGNAAINLIYIELDESHAKEVYSYYYSAHNCAVFAAPLLIYLIGYENLNVVFGIAFVIHVFVAIWYWLSFQSVGARKTGERATFLNVRPSRSLLHLFLSAFCYSLVYSQYFTNIPILINKVELGGRSLYPILVSLNGILVIILQQIYVYLCRRSRPTDILRVGSVCVLVSFVLFAAFPQSAGMLLCFAALFTLGEVLINPSVTSLIFELAPESARASWLGICQSARVAGGLGTMMGGFVLGNLGATSYLTYLLVATLPIIGISLLLTNSAVSGKPREIAQE